MDKLDSTEDFYEAIKEIQILINYSKRNQKNFIKYAAFNKAALVLLCAKFESFLENFLEEYAFEKMNASSNKTLSKYLYEHLVDNILEDLQITKNNPIKRQNHVSNLVCLCGQNEVMPVRGFKVNSKFKGGKHGQSEVERLLKTFGFKSVLKEDSTSIFFSKFNSLNNIRNNIVHEDATPSLTHRDVQEYLDTIVLFVNRLQGEANKGIM